MENWIVLNKFSSIHQAELRKDILVSNQVPAVVMQKMDSAFLLGYYELYVENDNIEKARALIDQFIGFTKINSYNKLKQVELFRKILEEKGIDTLLMRKSEFPHLFNNYELFVRNEDAEKVIMLFNGIDRWNRIDISDKIRQIELRTDILDKHEIDNIVIKHRDTEFHIDRIEIHVQNNDSEKAIELLDNLEGWVEIEEFDDQNMPEINIDILQRKGIDVILKEFKNTANIIQKVEVYVKENQQDKAIDIINQSVKWVRFKTYDNLYQVELHRRHLEENNIPVVVINEKGSMFLIGEIWLFVEEKSVKAAQEVIDNIEEIEEFEELD